MDERERVRTFRWDEMEKERVVEASTGASSRATR